MSWQYYTTFNGKSVFTTSHILLTQIRHIRFLRISLSLSLSLSSFFHLSFSTYYLSIHECIPLPSSVFLSHAHAHSPFYIHACTFSLDADIIYAVCIYIWDNDITMENRKKVCTVVSNNYYNNLN